MKRLSPPVHIGLRTLKTTAAVIIAMIIVNFFGTSDSKLIFAMLGAMAAVQPTFKESVESCLTQIIGVIFGAVMGILLQLLPVHHLVSTGIGIVSVITLYNIFHIHFSPSLPCMIVVMICTTPDILPISYAIGRIWDSAIGLGVGLVINILIFPYDNSLKIRKTIASLDQDLIFFLEELFDGDSILPTAREMTKKADAIAAQLTIFSNQRLFLKLKRQKEDLETFRLCEGKARELIARMEVLSRMERPGRLNEENRRRLTACGANIRDTRILDSVLEIDVVTNYHVKQILRLRRELLEALQK